MTMFSEQLDAAIRDRGWSHGEMARQMGNKQQNVSRWANGETLPRWPTVKRIAETLKEDPAVWAAAWQQSQEPVDRVSNRVDLRELEAIRKAIKTLAERIEALAERIEP